MIPRLCCLLLALLALPAGADYRQVVISEFGGPEMLRLVTRDTLPVPGPGEVRLRVLTASASFTDVMVRKGLYPEVSQEPPFPPGYDLVGIVDELGPGVDRFQVGDRVADLTVWGAYSEYAVRPAEGLVPVPVGLDDDGRGFLGHLVATHFFERARR